MSEDYPVLGLPAIRENPFQSRPLEARNSNLLVGRNKISTTWVRFLKSRTARLNLLVGESGTGRTSLMRCIAAETQKPLHLDMFHSDNHVQKILDEIYTKFVGFEIPSNNQELVDRLVETCEDSKGAIPLITFDYPNSDGEKLANIISNLLPALERLKAMVVVILSVNQRSQWPEQLIEKFEHLEIVKPFEIDEIREVCELRVNSVSNVAWKMPEEALDYVMNNSSGKASKIIRIMRDIVDFERENPREIKFHEEQTIVIKEEFQEEDKIDVETENKFDLDLDMLQEEPRNIIENQTANLPPLPATSFGGFGGLVSRNRVNMHVDTRFDDSVERKELDAKSDASDFWQASEMDAVLLNEEEETIVESEPEEPYYEEPEFVETFEPNHETISEDADYQQVLFDLFGKILKNNNQTGIETLSQLLMKLNTPAIGQRESNPLNVHVLRNLGKNEAVIVEVSTQRSFSPSDPRLQDQLRIKRPRMSQICNKLYRAGILSVQQKGKSRMFKLTNDAKVQLIAWGMMEAEV